MAKLKDGVIKRGNTWSYVIRVTDPETGASKPKWVGGFSSEADAKAARDEARIKARRGQYVHRSRTTVEQYLRAWLTDHAASVKRTTINGYREDLEHYVIPRLGRIPVQRLTPATITKFYRELVESGGSRGGALAPTTVRHVHRSLRKALNDAVAIDRLIVANPCNLAKLPRISAYRVEVCWTPDHLRIFLQFARSHRLYAFFHVAAYTGARRGEMLALRWSNVDFAAHTITLRASTDIVAGERIEDTPKGGLSRTIDIDPGTVAVLRQHRVRQLEDRAKIGPAWQDPGDFVFRRESGAELYPDTVTNLMTKLIRSYNEPYEPGRRGRPRRALPPPAVPLPLARLHDLRHLHATTLLLAGEALHMVSHRLGHADPAITLRVYAHVLRQRNAALADRFAREVGLSAEMPS